MKSMRDLLSEVKSAITEIEPDALVAGVTMLDVREPEEYDLGAIAGALHVPRGLLETRIEELVPERNRPIVIYCASGVRSTFAAETLGRMGYTSVASLVGGFNRWKDEGRQWSVPTTLTPDQRLRYQRHLLLSQVGEQGQLKLLDAKVLLLGAGGLGSPGLLYLAAAGVGTLGVVDMDEVDASNLQRQVIHSVDRIGLPKVESARQAVAAINPDVQVVGHQVRLGASNVMDLVHGYDLIIDGTDNFPTRYLVNDAALKAGGIPVVHGSIFRFEGQVTVLDPGAGGPCYRCYIPEPPPPELAPSCAEAGVLGVLPGIIGSLQAIEALKVLLGIGQPLAGRLIAYDALASSFRTFKLRKDPACPACGGEWSALPIAEYDQFCLPHR